ncbi:uncharacterized protein [Parasteatoda tepidariorum]
MSVSDMFFHRFKFSVLFELFFLASSVISAPNCNEKDLMSCMEELKVFTNNQDLAFAQTEEELSQTCHHLQEAMQCVNSFTSRCFDSGQIDLYRQMTKGAQSLLTDLCTEDSKFRKEYLIHASCYRNLSADYRRCADSYLLQQEAAKKDNLSVQDRLRRSCCLFDGYRECTRIAVEQKCNVEAARLGEQIITKAGGPMVQTHCASFKHDSEDCRMASSGNFLSSFPTSLILIVIVSIVFSRHYL